ncbi:LAME_0F08042g1_1 [Lachancea meyersii CBS 8951]|uniref:LAME_0F08042g1_1 n=1 Tax=Lachancea meyersii CBS 8951 TaxID=1266667 RepID=A0A1G4JUF6_9SACH|nr:LAME_0F08042g1_1 [Lachancea meyersii CBS 8951]
MILVEWTISLLFFCRLILSQDSKSAERGLDEVPFPEPLNAAEFQQAISQQLQVVEFYSPYCHFCKTLAPIWERAWRSFLDEGRQLNIALIQVNCVENGDLCAREKILAYPAIKLYGPGGFIKDFPANGKRTSESIINFARQEALNADNLDTALLRSSSEELKGAALLNLFSGSAEASHLVSFWPSKELRAVDDNSIEFENCENCHGFQKTWTLLSNKLANSNFKIGHVNCESERSICEELEFGDLVAIQNHRADRGPRVVLIVPQKKTNALFHYTKEDYSPSALEDFALRTSSNARVDEISKNSLTELISKPVDLKKGSQDSDGSIHVVFAYDPDTVVQEDFDILEHLVEPVSNIPGAFLHKSTDDIKSLSHSLFIEMYKQIKHDGGEGEMAPNEEYFTMKSITQLPTLYIFKQGSLISHVLNGYSTTEMRNLDLITKWFSQNCAPLISELTPANYGQIFTYNPELYDFTVIQMIDTSNKAEISKSAGFLDNLKLSAFGYESDRIDYLYKMVKEERNAKSKAVQSLKLKDALSTNIVAKMRDEIAHSDNHRIQLAFLDLSLHQTLLGHAGLQSKGRTYKNGDVIIVDKKGGSFFVEKNQQGNILTTETPSNLKTTLSLLSFATIDEKSSIIKERINNSRNAFFKSIGQFHESFSFLWYILLLAILIVLTRLPKLFRKLSIGRKYRNRRDVTGILGKQKSKD